MPTAVIVGGSVAGLTAALALRPLGYRVVVLEREAGPVPASIEEANADWVRPSVPQALHSHAFTSLGIALLRRRVPEVHEALEAAGAQLIDLGAAGPPALRDAPAEPGDAELRVLACRRRTFDAVLATTARRLGVEVRRGAIARGLDLSVNGAPRVRGVRLTDGSALPADIVVDATGRRTESQRWLADAAVPVAGDEVRAADITCYTRFYRCLGPGLPGTLNRGNAGGGIFPHYAAFVHPGDNRTFSIGIGVLPDDPAMKALRNPAAFTAAVAATPLLATWIAEEASEPTSPVHTIGFPPNTVRGAATTRQRPLHGLFQVGDAACVTNPLYGRGIALAIAHAWRLAEVLAEHPEPGEEQSMRFAEATESLLVPWFERSVDDDLERIRLWRATVHGQELPPLPSDYLGLGAAAAASMFDAPVWRQLTRVMMLLDPPERLFGDAAMRARIRAVLAERALPPSPAPGRAEMVGIVGEASR